MKKQKEMWEKANAEKERKRKEARERRIASGRQGILARVSLRRGSRGSRRGSDTPSVDGDTNADARTSRVSRLSSAFLRRGSRGDAAEENRGSRLSLISGFRRHKEPTPVTTPPPAPDDGSFKQPNVPTAVHQLPAPNPLPSYRHGEQSGAASRASEGEEEEQEEEAMLAGVKKASAASSSSVNASTPELPDSFKGAHGI